MKKPTIHMNGTSAKELYARYEVAAHALREAIDAVQLAGPNARDYYVQEPGAFEVARSEHEERLRKLTEVKKELESIWEAVADHV